MPPRPDVDPALLAVVNDHEQFLELDDEARARVRYVLLSHDNDGVTRFGPDLLSRRPDWLGPDRPRTEEVPGRSPRGIPAAMRWRPVTTFFQTLVDMKNAQVAGSYAPWGHDYRADLPEFVRDVYDLACTDEQLQRVRTPCGAARSSARRRSTECPRDRGRGMPSGRGPREGSAAAGQGPKMRPWDDPAPARPG